MATTGKQKGRAPSQECATLDTTEKQVHHTAHELPAGAGDVSRALVLEYEGQPVQFSVDGWINATQVAARFGKHLDDWLRLADTKKYMCSLARALNTADVREFMRTRRGRKGYTLLHPKLGVALARWCDTDFAVWCDLQIDRILRGASVPAWCKPAHAASTAADRMPLAVAIARLVFLRGVPCGAAWTTANDYAGVGRARNMRCGQVQDTTGFVDRLLAETATPADFDRLEHNRVMLRGVSAQLPLLEGGR